MSKKTRCGFVAIIGRPNVGKSTLLNHILGAKVAITSRKPQTTRHRLLGIHSTEAAQTIYVDTPGLHRGVKKALNRYMNRTAISMLHDVDVIVFLIETNKWLEDDQWALEQIKQVKAPVILAINKVDKLKQKDRLLPYIEKLSQQHTYAHIVPVSALTGKNLEVLQQEIIKHLPEAPPLFPDDQITDRSERFIAAEIIREKLMRQLGQEIPYQLTVDIEEYKQEKKLLRIGGVIYVEKASQKAIVIGQKGARLKRVGQQARVDLETLLGSKVFLRLWVKVKGKWTDSERSLKLLGYD